MKAAIQLLVARSADSILVLGDMKELGNTENEMHADVGRFAKAAGLKKLFCYGQLTQNTATAFGDHALHFKDHQSLIDSLKPQLTPQTTVLVKGSRSMKMETVVAGLVMK